MFLNLLTIVLIIVITFIPSNILSIILGLPFLLFFPGYTLIAALFPRKDALGSIERVALSFGLSIAVVSLIGLILNYTPAGIRLYPVLISVTIFIFTTSIVALFRQYRLSEVERPKFSFNLSPASWKRQSLIDKILSIILIAAILGSVGTLGYIIATPKIGERFSEFYVLGLEGKAENYPKEAVVDEEMRVIVGIVNREHETLSYHLEVWLDGIKNNEVGLIVLGDEQKWEEMVSFTPDRVGDNQKVEFFLYKNGQVKPCLEPLYLWVDVKEKPPE